jgi:GH35 family endo-1,4-beta-xylanase
MLTIDANRADGWNNNNVEIVFDESEVSSHKLEIKMAEGSEDKKFTILAIAYSDEEMNLTQDRSAKAAASELAGTTMLDVYKDSFKLGVALPNNVFNSMTDFDTAVKDNFNSITCENEMKPESLLDKEASASGLPDSYYEPAVHFDNCQPSINYCEENGIQMRFHTLVWHNQTPRWFFTEDYTDDGDLVDRQTMLRRMESYIKSVLTYFDKEHPGLIYAVDVVNEAFDVGDGDENGIRQKNNLWYEVVGPDYYVRAFEYASKYASDDYSLFYNDYSCMWKGDLILENLAEVKANGWIDGIGMQSHLSTSDDIDKFLETAKSFLDAGYEVQGTELDIGVKSSTNAEFQKQADLYKAYFEGMLELKNQGYNVTSITVWGIDDAHTWRSGEDPLLFDKDLKKKDAYYAIIEDYES